MGPTAVNNKNLLHTEAAKHSQQVKQGGRRDSSLNSTLKRAGKGQASQKLGQILLKEGLITQSQLDEAVKIMEKSHHRLGRIFFQ